MGVDHVPGYELDHRMMYWSMVNVNVVYKMMFVILARKLFSADVQYTVTIYTMRTIPTTYLSHDL